VISFSQILILIFLGLLLFGDSRQIFNKVILFFVNFKTLLKKVSSGKKNDTNSSDN
jgi:Sec-independent protein translocase protein TatA